MNLDSNMSIFTNSFCVFGLVSYLSESQFPCQRNKDKILISQATYTSKSNGLCEASEYCLVQLELVSSLLSSVPPSFLSS